MICNTGLLQTLLQHKASQTVSAISPGRLRAAQDVRDVLQAAVGERVDASSELARHLETERQTEKINKNHTVHFHSTGCYLLTLHSINTEFLTCSLVVLPLATSTMWKPVRPATGMKKRPATHITARLEAQRSQGAAREADGRKQ